MTIRDSTIMFVTKSERELQDRPSYFYQLSERMWGGKATRLSLSEWMR